VLSLMEALFVRAWAYLSMRGCQGLISMSNRIVYGVSKRYVGKGRIYTSAKPLVVCQRLRM
jgi:hypothetical protein